MFATSHAVKLESRFAQRLPKLATPWSGPNYPDLEPVLLNDQLGSELGLETEFLHSPAGTDFLSGVDLPVDAKPISQAYAGHQFGAYSPLLGDGRAALLGEIRTPADDLRDVHLKGSGETRFSRGGDGLAALGPMLREYLISEAMHGLGIPTTRSLAVFSTGRPVFRQGALPGALLVRTASSHIRVGSFQYARATDDLDLLRDLADFALDRHYPQAAQAENPYLEMLRLVSEAQAQLVANWMLVGFVHGVLNTDNVMISGESIDYGPCAFMDVFHPATVFSSIDTLDRYAYGKQPSITLWNLARFAETLLPLIDADTDRAIADATGVIEEFRALYAGNWLSGMRRKLGLGTEILDDDARPLADSLLTVLETARLDYTGFFRALTDAAAGNREPLETLATAAPEMENWIQDWQAFEPTAEIMLQTNPIYIPRNHLVEESLEAAASGDMAPFDQLFELVTNPFDEQAGADRYAQPAPSTFGAYVTYCGT